MSGLLCFTIYLLKYIVDLHEFVVKVKQSLINQIIRMSKEALDLDNYYKSAVVTYNK